jgi:predicted glycosyltransferase
MRILIDIGHPAHVHLFKNFAWIMQKKGYKFFFTTREKEFEIDLLTKYDFEFLSFGKKYKSIIGKIFGLFQFDFKMLLAAIRYKPDIFLSHGSIYAAQIAWLLGKPHISFEDTGNLEQVRLYKPFTKVILTSDVFPFSYGEQQIRYKGHHEIAYLSPKYFTPKIDIYKFLQINSDTKYSILRFVSWNASHDKGQKGIDITTKYEIINLLRKKCLRIFISSENELPNDLKQYKIAISPEKMHDVLYFSDIFIGEGATMAMEAGVLGTPSIYINSLERSYCQDLEQYDLVCNFSKTDGLLDKINELLDAKVPRSYYRKKREELLNNKIDVTAFMVWFVENYPESVNTMKNDPDFQMRFK